MMPRLMLAVLVILVALALGAMRELLIQVPERRADIRAWMNRITGLDFHL